MTPGIWVIDWGSNIQCYHLGQQIKSKWAKTKMGKRLAGYGHKGNLYNYAKGRGMVLWAYNEARNKPDNSKPSISQIAKISGQTRLITQNHLDHIVGPGGYGDLDLEQIEARIERYMLSQFYWDWL